MAIIPMYAEEHHVIITTADNHRWAPVRYSVTNEVTFLSNDVTDRYFLFRVTDQVTEVTFLVHYSVTFWSVTPLLRYSVTSLLHYSIHSSVLLRLIHIINNAVQSSPTSSTMQ